MDMTQTFHIVPEGSTGTRRAVMIGINYTGQDGELKGCQNDVKNVSYFASSNFFAMLGNVYCHNILTYSLPVYIY